jgi:hypothetical protein
MKSVLMGLLSVLNLQLFAQFSVGAQASCMRLAPVGPSYWKQMDKYKNSFNYTAGIDVRYKRNKWAFNLGLHYGTVKRHGDSVRLKFPNIPTPVPGGFSSSYITLKDVKYNDQNAYIKPSVSYAIYNKHRKILWLDIGFQYYFWQPDESSRRAKEDCDKYANSHGTGPNGEQMKFYTNETTQDAYTLGLKYELEDKKWPISYCFTINGLYLRRAGNYRFEPTKYGYERNCATQFFETFSVATYDVGIGLRYKIGGSKK